MTFVNVDGLKENLIVVSGGQIIQEEVDVLTGADEVFEDCESVTGCKLANKQSL